jgi:hypothetical protein
MRHALGHDKNGVLVEIDLIRSHAAKRISHQPHLLGLVSEVVRKSSFRGPSITLECDLGRPIGYSFIVATSGTDTIFYAQTLHDDVYTRFVKNGKPLASRYLTIVLERNEAGTYDLQDTWIGRLMPPRPGSPGETAESKTYWENHARILDDESLQVRTITKLCPY